MKKDEIGFGLVGILVIISIIALLCAVGWLVYDKQSGKNTSDTNQAQGDEPQKQAISQSRSTETGADNSTLDPTDLLEQYKLPQNWKEKECHKGYIAIIPPNTEDPNCNADQPNTTIVMYIKDNYNYIDPENCTYTKTKIDTKYDGFVSYDCSDVVIDGKKGIRETLEENASGFGGEATYTSYVFPADGKLFIIAYDDRKVNNDPDYLKEFDNFVKTLRFQ